jgi:aryl-alcohol dehydrogenase-like predicted oxidoreductase
MTMPARLLGGSGLTVSAIGFGCMGLSEFYGPSDDAQSLSALARAVELGIDFFDTADVYGPYHNESLLGAFLKSSAAASSLKIATKCGIVRTADPAARGVNNRPDYVRSCCEASLQRLGIETIDVYYLHRIDPEVPIEDSVGALVDLVAAGKIRAIGLSEPGPQTLRRAHAAHPIAAVQCEYSLSTRELETSLLPVCRELGIAFVAYSPLGRGLLTDARPDPRRLAEDDFRRRLPRFQGEAWAHNRSVADALAKLAASLGVTSAQLALAWLLHRGDDIVPIPGSKRVERVEENAAAIALSLSPVTLSELDRLFAPGAIVGDRSSMQGMALLGK